MMKSNGGTSGRKRRSKSCSKETKESYIPNLPEELIFLILTWIPADILYTCMRYVCKQWNQIIRNSVFQQQHRPVHSSGLFFAQNNSGYFSNLVKSEVLRTELELPIGYKVRAGCDELLLLEPENGGNLHIANPITRRITKTPPIRAYSFPYSWSFLRLSSSKEYKVILAYFSIDRMAHECAVLTLGKGCAWKVIPYSEEMNAYIMICSPTFCIGDMVFWVNMDEQYIVGFCAESEETYRLPCPNVIDCERSDNCFIPGGELFSLVVEYRKRNSVEIWCLYDPKGVAEWKRMYKIEFGGTISPLNLNSKAPKIWVNKEMVVFLLESSILFGYNVKTGKGMEIGRIERWQHFLYCEFVCGFTWIQLKDDVAQS